MTNGTLTAFIATLLLLFSFTGIRVLTLRRRGRKRGKK